MRIVSLASGSRGNATLVEHCGSAILVDCGVPYKALKWCEFDAVLMPNVMAGNTVMKVLTMSANVNACGVLAGTRVPVAITSRSSMEEQVFLSLCVAAAMLVDEQAK